MGADKGTLRRQLRGPSQRPCPSTGILMNWRAVLARNCGHLTLPYSELPVCVRTLIGLVNGTIYVA